MTGYDIIGDIHGHGDKLEALLRQMGYAVSGLGYKAPAGRQAVFLGDLIDRGPRQIRVLEIVRAMVDSGHARCILGNHEMNAIGYMTEDATNPGEYLRPNRGASYKCIKNREQHAAFIDAVRQGSAVHKGWLAWFKNLPPFLDLGGIRVVHGCWDDDAVAILKAAGWHDGAGLTDKLLQAVYAKDSALRSARQLLTCGMELPLPEGRFITDKSGHKHTEVRIANWRDWASEIHQLALVPKGQEEQLKDMEWPAELVLSAIEGAPIFVGHHWFRGHPVIESPKLACLDWSAARGGPLVAYRWDGETELSNDKLVWAGEVVQ
jgi:Calcineurin-like phosphoesterase